MDQSQFQAYEVAGATDMNRLHQFPQDYFQEVVEGLIGDNSDALFGTAGFSSAIVAGPLLQIIVNAQTFAAGGRIGSVVPTLSHHASSIPANTQRFYIYLDIQTTEVTEVRDVANPGTGVKTPTPIVTHKTVAASVVVIEVDQGNPEAPPAIGVIAPGVERLGYIKLGYVDYNEIGATNVDVFNSAAIFSSPGTPNVSLVSLDDIGDVSAPAPTAGDLLQYDGSNWANVTVLDAIADALRHVNGLRLTTSVVAPVPPDSGSSGSIYLLPYTGPQIALYDGTRYVLRTALVTSLALAGLTANLPYDVFAYLSAGVPALELEAWTSATVRNIAVSRIGGVLSKSGDQTRRYIGTIVPDSATTIGFSPNRKPVWNYYNRVVTRAHVALAGASYLVPDTAGIFRQVNADPTNVLEIVRGINEDVIDISAQTNFFLNNNAGAGSAQALLGIGFESTTVSGAYRANIVQMGAGGTDSNEGHLARAEFTDRILEGFRLINWLEYAALTAGGTANFFCGAAPISGSGIVAILPM